MLIFDDPTGKEAGKDGRPHTTEIFTHWSKSWRDDNCQVILDIIRGSKYRRVVFSKRVADEWYRTRDKRKRAVRGARAS